MSKLKSFFTAPFKFINRQKWWLIAAAVLLLGGFLYYRHVQASKPKLTFGRPTRDTLTQTLDASGTVDAKEKAALHFALGGKIVYLGAKEGDIVKKYQTIATIDSRDLQKRLEKSLNLYSQQRNAWDQTLDNTKDRALPESEIRTVNTDQLTLNNTVADVELSSIAISNNVMSSPLAGVLVSAPTTVAGVVLAPTDGFLIVNPSSLVFEAQVDEADIAKVKKGQKVILKLDAFPDEPITTTVTSISYLAVQTSSGTAFNVEMAVPPMATGNTLDRYRLGMNGDVKIELATRENVLNIPLSATRERDGKFFVDVRTGPAKYQEREIQVGLQTDTSVEVTGGLSQTDEILLPN